MSLRQRQQRATQRLCVPPALTLSSATCGCQPRLLSPQLSPLPACCGLAMMRLRPLPMRRPCTDLDFRACGSLR